MSDGEKDAALEQPVHKRTSKADPIEQPIKSSRSEKSQDPYVIRAIERAKIKTRDCIVNLNRGRIN